MRWVSSSSFFIPHYNLLLLSLSLFLPLVSSDVYLHSPRGSNNKLSEESNNVNNNKRVFDSENNNKGGYQVGDRCERSCDETPDDTNQQYDETVPGAMEGTMEYIKGSELYIEWTNQHGCGSELEGNTNVLCAVVLQYMCDEDNRELGRVLNNGGTSGGSGDPSRGRIRDGVVRGNQNKAGGNSEPPVPEESGAETTRKRRGGGDDYQVYSYAQHEPLDYYLDCRARERNKGLYTADKNLNENIGATATRQEPQENRHGLECPEERDYYPYWHPSPWRDIAIFTSEPKHRCDFYQKKSQNVDGKNYCTRVSGNNNCVVFNQIQKCHHVYVCPAADRRKKAEKWSRT